MNTLNLRRALLAFLMLFAMQTAHAQTATVMDDAQPAVSDAVALTPDPLEKFNRASYGFNEAFDNVLLRPAAKAYQKVVPTGGRGCIHGIFENLSVPYTAVNNLLQGKFKAAGQDICRFVINSTVGLGGCFDVASQLDIPKHDEDFGQTLGVWGVPAGPFVMIPGLGPSTVRDALAKPIDMLADPIGYIQLIKVRNISRGLRLIDTRTTLLDTLDFADDVAFDKYALLRDVWLQNRESNVRDEDYEPEGKPLEAVPDVVPAVTEPVPTSINDEGQLKSK